MTRILLIDQNRASIEPFAQWCLDRGIAFVVADTLCEGVRVVSATPVSLIVVDHGRLRLRVSDQAALFDRVAPGVPVVVTANPEVPLEARVALELGGFHVVPSPWQAEDLLKALASA